MKEQKAGMNTFSININIPSILILWKLNLSFRRCKRFQEGNDGRRGINYKEIHRNTSDIAPMFYH